MKTHNQPKLLSSAILFAACLDLSAPAYAKEEWSNLYGNPGRCDICHTGTVGTADNVKSAAKSAFNSGGLNPGLKSYATSFLANEASATPNTKAPVLNAVNTQWDVIAGESITIPLIYSDADEDNAEVIKKAKLPAGATLTDVGIDTATQLSRWDFNWTPTEAQKNKSYTLKFAAKETATAKRKTSNVITTKVRVWPTGDQDSARIKSFILSSASWKLDVLTLKGKVVLSSLLNASEKANFFARTDLTVDIFQGKTTTGTAFATANLSFKPNGSWILSQPLLAPFPCDVSLVFEGRPASKKIAKAPASCGKS
jgi:hypothetical protein